ncbi:MAG: hypothetical protein KGR25_13375, partial [Chloroflexi bacterium]|nr:hypothetical protein [Chloroflexota bacterium]
MVEAVCEVFVAAVVPKFCVEVAAPRLAVPATFNVRLTGVAAATLLLPAWLAVIVVTPGATATTLVELSILATFV